MLEQSFKSPIASPINCNPITRASAGDNGNKAAMGHIVGQIGLSMAEDEHLELKPAAVDCCESASFLFGTAKTSV